MNLHANYRNGLDASSSAKQMRVNLPFSRGAAKENSPRRGPWDAPDTYDPSSSCGVARDDILLPRVGVDHSSKTRRCRNEVFSDVAPEQLCVAAIFRKDVASSFGAE